MRETLKRLLNAYGATGHEEAVREVIREMVEPWVDSIEVDALGNLICVKKGAGRRVMLAAHMDQIGFVVSEIDEKGFLRVFNVGGIRSIVSLNRHVVFENGVHGVVSYEQEGFKPGENSMRPLFIDIGAKDRADAERKVQIGDVAVYVPDVFELGDDLMGSPAMDNRVGCAVLIDTLRRLKDCPNEVCAVFTVQEEVGLRGAVAAAYGIDPEMGIGPCIKVLDNSVICSPKVVALMETAAEREGIAAQREVLTGGGTDAGAMQKTRAGVPCGVLSVACRYVHSACEVISIADAQNGAKLLAGLLNSEICL